LTAAVSLLKSRAGRTTGGKGTPGKPREQRDTRTPQKNDGAYAWKDVAPKAGKPNKKKVKDKTYFWCTCHKQPQWTLHNPDSFLNLCKYHPKYSELEAAWKAGTSEPNNATADNIQLDTALAAMQDSESESEDP
jgi:hypothetical protein